MGRKAARGCRSVIVDEEGWERGRQNQGVSIDPASRQLTHLPKDTCDLVSTEDRTKILSLTKVNFNETLKYIAVIMLKQKLKKTI